jgi:Zn-dependent protease
MHEYGHALACRKVGGRADHIVLWPLGGVAYVDAPQRPGATLWSIVAGPLVNVVLAPVLLIALTISIASKWQQSRPDVYQFVLALFAINAGLLIFNILPIYPLDGGQILRSLLWYIIGRARSLMVATVIGFFGVVALAIYGIRHSSTWLLILGVFIVMNCWGGFKHSLALMRLAKIPRRHGFSCPWCKSSPLLGNFWSCVNCGAPFDAFASNGICPSCANHIPGILCLDCGHPNPICDWSAPVAISQNA